MKVDFHVHSTASDGTLTPRELARRAYARGYTAISLTDHDNLGGAEEFLAYVCDPDDILDTEAQDEHLNPNPNLARLVGVELSIEPGAGFDKFHLLGIGVNPQNPALRAFLARILDERNARNARILANFARLGIVIPPEELAAYANGEVLARPHFACWLVDHGHAPTFKDAFAAYLLPDSPRETRAYEDRWHPAQEDAFAVIHAAGGLCIMAHPKYWRNEWRHVGPDYAVAQRELGRLKEIGLDGLESVYQANYPREDLAWTLVAERTGLLKSAGSDYHGANKPTIRLGMSVEEIFIRPLLERLGI